VCFGRGWPEVVRKSRSTRGAGLSRVTHIVSPLESHPDEGIWFGGFKAAELIGRTRSRFSRRKPPNLPFIAIARKLLVALNAIARERLALLPAFGRFSSGFPA
jgi:hypothetical protein